ncbi:MAG: hypothetical protein EPN36_14215 [Rhodanobacteraceae bacterium]|nr:MAG: hypothetical protein EPN36_14215 [Rhodanobacteraceae bacterium]
MIEGLKVTVEGVELRELCIKQAEFHEQRRDKYAASAQTLGDVVPEGANYSGGDPKKALADKVSQHDNSARELRFIAAHIVPHESYLLDNLALVKLGISRSAFGA